MTTFRTEPGWLGHFTREEVLGAYRNSTRVEKTHDDTEGDPNPKGSLGTVLGSVTAAGHVAYFVEWDHAPRIAALVVSQQVIAHGCKKRRKGR